MAIVIRSLQEPDAPQVFSILREVYAAPEYPIGGAWNLRLVESELDRGGGIGAYFEGQLRSFILYSIQPQVWEISLLATAPAARRKGDMRALLKALLERLPSQTDLWLEVHEANSAARNLYEKMGFREVGRRARYYRDGSAAVLYSLR